MCFRVQSHTRLALSRIPIRIWNGTLPSTLWNWPRQQARWLGWLLFGWYTTTCWNWTWKSIPVSSAAMCPRSGLNLNHAKWWVYVFACGFVITKRLRHGVLLNIYSAPKGTWPWKIYISMVLHLLAEASQANVSRGTAKALTWFLLPSHFFPLHHVLLGLL